MLIIQMTGLPGAGKTTIALAAQTWMKENGYQFEIDVIDGDEYRKKLYPQLGFSKEDRIQNIERLGAIAEASKLKGLIPIIASINPYTIGRAELKRKYGAKLVWIKCGLEELIRRDPKGLYKRALMQKESKEKLHNLTGINDPFDEVEDADLIIDTETEDVVISTTRLMDFIFNQVSGRS